MSLRTLTNAGDPLIGADGQPKASVVITFQLVDAAKLQPVVLFDASSDGGDLVIGDIVTATTNSAGEFTTALWPNNRGEIATLYKVRLPGGVAGDVAKPFYIRVTDGDGALTLLAAKTAMQALQPQTLSLFDALLANIISIVGTATALATATTNGLLSYVDKVKLNSLASASNNALVMSGGMYLRGGAYNDAGTLILQGTTGVQPSVIAASAAAVSTLFIDSADGNLKFKDAAGTVRSLY